MSRPSRLVIDLPGLTRNSGRDSWKNDDAPVIPSNSVSEANPYCTHVVATGIGHARNLAVVSSGDAVIAIGGEWGTLSEIGFARAIDRPVITLRSWTLSGRERMEDAPGALLAESPREAVGLALEVL